MVGGWIDQNFAHFVGFPERCADGPGVRHFAAFHHLLSLA